MKTIHSSSKGFTLVEIMIVVVIIGLLAAMAIPAFQKVRTNSQDKAVLNNARQLSAGADQYYLENGVSSCSAERPHRADAVREGAQLGGQRVLSGRLHAGHHDHDRKRRRASYDHVRAVIDIPEVFSRFKAARITWAAFFGFEANAMNGSPLRQVLADRRLWLFALVSAASAATGFILVPDRMALSVVTSTGYWCVLAAFVLFVRALWRTYREDLAGIRKAGARGFDWVSLAVVAFGGTVLIVHESFGFKIVMDEVMLVGTSMSMHFTRTVLTPIRGGDVQGAFVIFEGMMDKRQLFFPFLVSILHDLTGLPARERVHPECDPGLRLPRPCECARSEAGGPDGGMARGGALHGPAAPCPERHGRRASSS